MSEQRPTREQWLAVNLLDRDIAVTAGAGSGKTWVLTRRYVTQLAGRPVVPEPHLEATDPPLPSVSYPDPVSPEQIIAITFTEKAATEMKERIRGELERLCRMSSDHEREKWLHSIDDLEGAVITTIHGLCARLIRQFPLQAQINPHFRVLETHEADALFQQALESVISDGLAAADPHILRLAQEYPMRTLKTSIRQLFDQMRERMDPLSWHETVPCAKQVVESQRLAAIEEGKRLCMLGDSLHLAEPEKAKNKFEQKMAETFHVRWPAWRETIAACDGWWNDTVTETAKQIWEACKYQGRVPKSYELTLPPFLEQFRTWANAMCSPAYLELAEAVVHFLRTLESTYQTLKRKRHALDFTDLQITAVRLLAQPKIRDKVTAKIRYVMVDEFQDTNHMQARLVRYLAERAKLFIVGDAKQSIYAFRQADVGVFLELQKEIRTDRQGETLELRHNFRTVSPIIDFVNRFFAALMPAVESGADGSNAYRVGYDDGMVATRLTPDSEPRIEWLHNPLDADADVEDEESPQQSDSMQARLKEAELIAKRIRLMCEDEHWIVKTDPETGQPVRERVRYGDITLLFSAMTHVRLYEFMLQKYNIPYYIIGGRNFYQRQEILDVLHILRVLLNPQDELSLVGALRSPMFGVSDEGLYWLAKDKRFRKLLENPDMSWLDSLADRDRQHVLRFCEWVRRWRDDAGFAPIADMLERIYEDTGIREIVLSQFGGMQKLGNLQKLQTIARTYESEKQFGLPEFVAFLGQMVEQKVDEKDAEVTSLDEDVVKIMTIHQSKGLEFPVVILPDLARKPKPDSVNFVHHPQYGLGIRFNHSENFIGSNERKIPLDGSGMMQTLMQETKDRAQQEERRKLYVAMTRARDYLILVGSKKTAEKDLGKALQKTVWLDWLSAIVSQEHGDDIDAACQRFGIRYLTPEALEERWLNRCSDKPDLDEAGDKMVGKPLLIEDIPLSLRFEPQDVLRMHSMERSYRNATMIMLESENPIRYRRVFQMGLPDWQEWDASDLPSPQHRHDGESEQELRADLLGTVVHKICERLTAKEQAKEVTLEVLEEFGLSCCEESESFKEVWTLVKRYVESDIFREICTAASVRSEVPFRVVLDGQEITGVIDKWITDAAGNVTVIDFKTNRITDENRTALQAKYQPQMDVYRRALETILGKPVQTKLVFIRDL
jgi:ATP-dependent helicase/nuclease subunit A